MSAIPFVRISKEQLRDKEGGFTLIRGTALRGRLVPQEQAVEGSALPFFVVNESKHYKIGDHLYAYVEGNPALPVCEVDPSTPLTGLAVMAIYLENEGEL